MYSFPQINNYLSPLGAKKTFTFSNKNLTSVYIKQETNSIRSIAIEYYLMTNKIHVTLSVFKHTNR